MRILSRSREVPQPTQTWNALATVESYRTALPRLHWYERQLLRLAAEKLYSRHSRGVSVRVVHVVGCGAGRELPGVAESFPGAQIVASDIAPAMIEACEDNLKRWGCQAAVEFRRCPASALEPSEQPADLVVAFNNILTLVTSAAERRKTLQAIQSLLRPGGLLIGVVHYRWGRVLKSSYFGLRWVSRALRLMSADPGDRIGITCGFPDQWHYFTRSELRELLWSAGLEPIEILSLTSLASALGRKPPFLRSDNNLVFVAEARKATSLSRAAQP